MKFIKSMKARSELLKKFKNIMLCDNCGEEQIIVHDTRIIEGIIRRRRICTECGNRTTTYEIRKEDFEMLLNRDNSEIPNN